MSQEMSPASIKEYHALHNEAVSISKGLVNQEFKIIEILQKIDDKKVYRFMGFPSLSQYARLALKLAEDRAYLYIGIARKAKNLSRMQQALKDGGLKISQAKRICSVITPKNEEHWLKLAKELPQRNLERAIAQVNPKSQVQEGTRFISEKTLEFKAAIDIDTEGLVRRAQHVLSQSLGRAATFEETLREMAKAYLDKKDPVVKAQRILSRKIKTQVAQEEPQSAAFKNSPEGEFGRKPNPTMVKHQINARDLGKCQGATNGVPCGESRWVDFHHKVPVSEGGQNILENLVTLCRGHHQMEHQGEYTHVDQTSKPTRGH